MSDQKKDEELDDVSGGVRTNPTQPIPIDPPIPHTHPIIPGAPIKGKTKVG
jgi:hypothetical protein